MVLHGEASGLTLPAIAAARPAMNWARISAFVDATTSTQGRYRAPVTVARPTDRGLGGDRASSAVTAPGYGRSMNDGGRDRPAPVELDEHDLGAHSQHLFRLYGGETVRVADLRGEPWSENLDVTVKFLNIELNGRLSTLRDFAEALTAVLEDAVDQPQLWPEVPGRKARFFDERGGLTSPFSRRIPIPPRRRPGDG